MKHTWCEFHSSLASPSWCFTDKWTNTPNIWLFWQRQIFGTKFGSFCTIQKRFEHNWVKNSIALRVYFWALFANLDFLNFIACAIVQWRWWFCCGSPFHFHTFTFTLSISHFHFHTFILSHRKGRQTSVHDAGNSVVGLPGSQSTVRPDAAVYTYLLW